MSSVTEKNLVQIRLLTHSLCIQPTYCQQRNSFPERSGIMVLMLSAHQSHTVTQLHCNLPSSCRLSSRSCPQISLPQRGRQHPGLCKPVSRNASNLILCAASSQTMSAGSAKPLRFIQHKEEAFWFYRFLSIVYDHIGTQSLLCDFES